MWRTTTAAAIAVVLGGCGKSPDKRSRCERVLGDLLGGVVAGISVGLGEPDDPEARCMREHPRDPARCMDPDDAADYRARLAKLVDECVRWPDETLRCFQTFEDSPACERAFAALEGLDVSEVKSEGPAPAWELSLDGDEPISRLVAAGGAVYAVAGDEVIAIADGKVRWRAAVPGADALAPGACVVAVGDEEVVCLDAASGEPRWRVPAAVSDGDDDDRTWRLAAWRRDEVLLVGDRGAVGLVAPAKCGLGPCVDHDAPLLGVDDDPLTRSIAVLPGGGWAYLDDRWLDLIGADGVATFRLRVEPGDGYVTDLAVTPGGALVAGWDRTIYRIDPLRCRGGLQDERSVRGVPPGCLTVLADRTEEPGDGWAPLPLGEDGVAFTIGSQVHVWRGGERVWAADVEAASGVVAGDATVAYVATAGALGSPPAVRALALGDGATTWRTRLGSFEKVGFLDAPLLAGDDAYVYVAHERRIAALPRR